ncbi:MAG TPA: multicopper oxidase family protein [Anaerolineales bacterium]|nr:multicopper oxidase family protein [Anaerolineales bacterium]
MSKQTISRREFLRLAGVGATAMLASGFRLPSQMEPFVPDAEIAITAKEKYVQILSGAQTRVWSYEGQLLSGSGVTVQAVPGSYLGPILRAKTGTKLRIYFHNQLAEDSVIHPHGPRVPEAADGHPMSAIGPGQTMVYEFEVIDRAGPYWFHPHPHMRTAEQVAMGMAGLLYVWDDDEALTVPGASTGANDIPVILQDRNFDSANQILYNPNNMWGYLGSRILVNGKPNTVLSLEPRAYRLRILNGSNARTYKLGWSNGMPLQVIGTDGGLLPAVATRNYVMLMPGERIDLWVDFAALARKQVILRSLSFDPGGMMGGGGMGGGGMGGGGGGMGSGLPMGSAFDILTVNVGRRAGTRPALGPLPPLPVVYNAGNVPNYSSPRPFSLDMSMMTWTINGRVFEMMEVAEDEMVNLHDTMAWEWINNTPIPHPMHMHNVQFQVVQRTPSSLSSYATIHQGLVDSGWKDTVLVWPGERVKIAMTFGPHAGMYMYHCHILEHEDMTMMRNYMIMDHSMPME